MYTLNERQVRVVELLLKKDNTKKEMLELLQVSEKTLRSDINTINNLLSEHESGIENEDNVLHFKSIYDEIYWINFLRLNQRVGIEDLIKLKLLLKDEYCTLNDLAEELYISKSKLEKELNKLDFRDVGLVKIRNRGIKVNGELQERLFEFISIIRKYIDDVNYLVSTKLMLNQVLDTDISEVIFHEVVDKHKKDIKVLKIVDDELIRNSFLLLLLSSALDYPPTSIYEDFIHRDYGEEKKYCAVFERIIDDILDNNNIIVEKTSVIYQMFLKHLTKFETSDYMPNLDDGFVRDIETRFPFSVKLTDMFIKKLEEEAKIDFSNIEKYYIIVYFQSLINSGASDKRLNINIICQYGLSFANYIALKLQHELGDDIKIKTFPLYEYLELRESGEVSGIAVTTLRNLDDSLYINPVPTDEEILHLLNQIKIKKAQEEFANLIKGQYFTKVSGVSQDELKEKITEDILEQQMATEEYIESYKDRIDKGLTVLNKSIVVHGDPMEVRKNGLLVYKIDDGLSFQGEEINLVFVLLLDEEYLKNSSKVIREFYKILLDDEYGIILHNLDNLNQLQFILNNNLMKNHK